MYDARTVSIPCGKCGQSLRYVFVVRSPEGKKMNLGGECCAIVTGMKGIDLVRNKQAAVSKEQAAAWEAAINAAIEKFVAADPDLAALVGKYRELNKAEDFIDCLLYQAGCNIIAGHDPLSDNQLFWLHHALERAVDTRISEWQGKEGDKVKGLHVKGLMCKGIETQFGVSWLSIMVDDNGNVWKLFSNSFSISAGEVAVIKGSIKGHEEHDGKKQTVLTRVSLYKTAAQEKAEVAELVDRWQALVASHPEREFRFESIVFNNLGWIRESAGREAKKFWKLADQILKERNLA